MAQRHSEQAGIIRFVAQALSICGIVAVSVYDFGKAIVGCAYDVGKAMAELVSDIGVYGLERDEEIQLTEIVMEYERRKEKLFYLIGKQYSDLKNQKEKEGINQYIAEVQDCEKTIIRLKERITELKELQSLIREQKTLLRGWKSPGDAAMAGIVGLDEFGPFAKELGEMAAPTAIEGADFAKRETVDAAITEVVKLDEFGTPAKELGEMAAPTAIEGADPAERETIKAIDAAIAEIVELDKFGTPKARVIFKKVAADLLDSDLGNKILAVTELGKIGNNAAVPILMAAVNFRHPELISEIIKTLTALGDSRAMPLMYEEVANPDYRVRSACLRGLFKLTDDEKEMPVLINGLLDKHHEVRRTAVTLLGWKGRADDLPALTQCLKDEDAKVRRATVSALANIKNESSMLPLINILSDENLEVREKALDAIRLISGKTVEFSVKATDPDLTVAINKLKDQFQKKLTAEKEEAVAPAGPDLTVAINNLRDRFQKKPIAKKEEAVAPATKPVKEHSKAEGETAQIELDEVALRKMNKVELLALSLEHGIKGDATLTKAEIIRGILTKKKTATTRAKTAKKSGALETNKPTEVKR